MALLVSRLLARTGVSPAAGRWLLWRVLLVSALICAAVPPAVAQGSEDGGRAFRIKAAFVLNFARFVQWPTNAFATPTNDLVIGVLGENPFGSAIETIEGKTVEQRVVRVKHFQNLPQAEGEAHLLFIAESEKPRWKRIFEQLANKPILTVSDVDGFPEAGGMINLKTRQDMLRFDINREAAERCGLKISSKLLKLADNYRDR